MFWATGAGFCAVLGTGARGLAAFAAGTGLAEIEGDAIFTGADWTGPVLAAIGAVVTSLKAIDFIGAVFGSGFGFSILAVLFFVFLVLLIELKQPCCSDRSKF